MQHLIRLLQKELKLPDDAIAWLSSLWNTIHFFDDVADGDYCDRAQLDSAMWNALVAMPANAFFRKNMDGLLPVMANAMLKWQASDAMERAGNANERSFIYRASFYDVLLMVFQLVHGAELAIACADKILALYGESFEDYKKEFNNA